MLLTKIIQTSIPVSKSLIDGNALTYTVSNHFRKILIYFAQGFASVHGIVIFKVFVLVWVPETTSLKSLLSISARLTFLPPYFRLGSLLNFQINSCSRFPFSNVTLYSVLFAPGLALIIVLPKFFKSISIVPVAFKRFSCIMS